MLRIASQIFSSSCLFNYIVQLKQKIGAYRRIKLFSLLRRNYIIQSLIRTHPGQNCSSHNTTVSSLGSKIDNLPLLAEGGRHNYFRRETRNISVHKWKPSFIKLGFQAYCTINTSMYRYKNFCCTYVIKYSKLTPHKPFLFKYQLYIWSSAPQLTQTKPTSSKKRRKIGESCERKTCKITSNRYNYVR